MAHHYDDEAGDFDEEGYDPDEPETYPHGLYADDGLETIPCPHCGADILEESEQCPKCRMYLSKEDSPTSSRSGTWWLLIVLALLAVILMIFG